MSAVPTITRRSLLKAAGLTALVGMPATACGSSSGAGGTLDFYQSKPEVITYFDKVVEQFTAKTGQAVRHDATTSLVASFVRDSPHDVLLQNYLLDFATFVSRGVLSDLSDLPAAATIDPKVQDLVNQYATYRGQTNVIPYSMTAAGVIYNTQLFESSGVKVPTTWTEMIAACETFKSKGVTPIYMTFKDGWTTKQGLFDYVTGSDMNVADFFGKLKAAGTKVDADSPVSFTGAFGPSAAKVLQLVGYANSNAATRGYSDGNAAFATGKVAMYFQGPWAIGEVAKLNPKLTVRTFALPATDNPADTKVRVNLDLGLAIPLGAKMPAAARELLSYLMTPAVIEKYNTDNLAYSPIKGSTAPVDERVQGVASYVKSGKFYQGAGTFFPFTIPLENYLQEFVITGNTSGFLTKLDNDWRRLAQRSL